ncbi:hypothetical protein EOL70_10475 [Leucothrix sargassi]|nr:hypothetical protein EOL70_10475 [Leucothrix sargassi]
MKKILTNHESHLGEDRKDQYGLLKKSLLSLAICSVFAAASAENNSFTIRIVEKQPAVSATPKPLESKSLEAKSLETKQPEAKASKPKASRNQVTASQPVATDDEVYANTSVTQTVTAAVPATFTQPHGNYGRTLRLDDGGIIWTTSDPVALTPLLEVTTQQNVELLKNKQFEPPISFTLNTNYSAFIDTWELAIYHSSDQDQLSPIKVFTGNTLINGQQVKWDGSVNEGEKLTRGDELNYVLTVKDKGNRIDETHARAILLKDHNDTTDIAESIELRPQSNLAKQTIPLYGSRVRIHGNDIRDNHSIEIDGEKITITNQRFVVERLLPQGEHIFKVNIKAPDNRNYHKNLAATVSDRYLFMVGLADVTVGEGSVSDNLETLSDGDKYLDGDIFVDGRLAFYLKGKIKGRYLVTAQMDTGTAEIDELFDDIHKKDPESLFRRLDPDKYYPVYGDDSTISDDTDSQGKIYVRVDWDKSRGLWGNFNTDMTGTELSSFNRTLYGAKINRKSTRVTEFGDHRTDVTVFASEAQSAARHVEFLGTGGSLYYLKDTDIVDGSEKIWVEVRDNDTGNVLERITMEQGQDYQIDDFQGRVILNRPLLQIAEQGSLSIIKNNPLADHKVYLVADYEYVPDEFDSDQATYGARGKAWLGDHVAIGGSYAHENRDNDDDYDLKGVDLTLKKSKGTYLIAEYAETEAVQTSGSFSSTDGGLNFDELSSDDTVEAQKGRAYSVEGRVNLEDYSNKKGAVAAWYKNKEAGFSSANNIDQIIDEINIGIQATIKATKNLELAAKVTQVDKENTSKVTTASVQGAYDLNSRFNIGAELRQVKEEDFTGVTAEDGKGTLAAIKLGYDVNDDTNIYAIGQKTLSESGSYESNDLFTLGASTQLNDRLTLNAEASSGDRGDAAVAGLDYKINDRQSVYTNYTLSTDSTFDKRNVFTLGQRRNVTNRLDVYTEYQFTHESEESGLGHTFGVDYDFNKYMTLSGSLQTIDLDDDAGSVTQRDSVTAGITYERGKTKGSSRLEYRKDENTSSSEPENTEQWVTTNSIHYRYNPSIRLQAKLNHSVTKDKDSGDNDATFTEAGIGFAYRPINHDRLNILGRVNYLYDLQPLSQSDDADEKSLIASLESTYEVNQRWDIGGKIAHKHSEIRLDRDTGEWVDNDASLVSGRITYHMTHNWDAMAGYHWLNSDASEDSEHGAVISLDRHLGKNFKVGVGYNFTSFNDDLSDLDGDAKGWFLNIVGKF